MIVVSVSKPSVVNRGRRKLTRSSTARKMLLLLKKGRYAQTGPNTVEAAAISQVTSQQAARDVENAILTDTLRLTLLSKRITLQLYFSYLGIDY